MLESYLENANQNDYLFVFQTGSKSFYHSVKMIPKHFKSFLLIVWEFEFFLKMLLYFNSPYPTMGL